MATADTPQPRPTLRILETRVLRGPNIWSRSPAIVMLVDLGVLEDFPSNTIPGFNEALVETHSDARGSRLLARPARRLHQPPGGGHLARSRDRACRARAPEPGRHGVARWQDARRARRTRPLQRRLRVPRRGCRSRGGPLGRGAGQPSCVSSTRRRSISPTRSRRSSSSPSGAPSGRRRRRSSTRRCRATFRGSDSIQLEPRPVGPGRSPAAHPGHDDLAHERDRR